MPPRLVAPVRLGGKTTELVARDGPAVGNPQTEDQPRVEAGNERDRERADLVATIGLNGDCAIPEPMQSQELDHRAAPVHLAMVTTGDCRGVESVVEVRVTEQHGIGTKKVTIDRRLAGHHRPSTQEVCQ